MTWTEEEIVTERDLRNYGFLVGIVVLLLFGVARPIFWHRRFLLWPCVLGGAFVLVGMLYPLALKPARKVWMAFARAMGTIQAFFWLSILYYVVFTPISFFFRVRGRDRLRLKKSEGTTFRVVRSENARGSMANPY